MNASIPRENVVYGPKFPPWGRNFGSLFHKLPYKGKTCATSAAGGGHFSNRVHKAVCLTFYDLRSWYLSITVLFIIVITACPIIFLFIDIHFVLFIPYSQERKNMSSSCLPIEISNQTVHQTVYCYIVGLAADKDDTLMFISSDGKTPYFPPNPSSMVTPLPQDCSILLGCPGQSISVAVP